MVELGYFGICTPLYIMIASPTAQRQSCRLDRGPETMISLTALVCNNCSLDDDDHDD